MPKFDFLTGKRTKGRKMRLAPNELLVIEGIHGLNSRLTQSVPADKKYNIFICPLTGTNIDFHNRLGTTDTRLIRRLVRDARTRGHSAEATLKQWPSVVRGSFRHIFRIRTTRTRYSTPRSPTRSPCSRATSSRC